MRISSIYNILSLYGGYNKSFLIHFSSYFYNKNGGFENRRSLLIHCQADPEFSFF